jgi:hypothetical protein
MKPNVVLCGSMRSGKDSIARYLCSVHGYRQMAFAKALKADLATMLYYVANDKGFWAWLHELNDGPMKESFRPLMQWYGSWRREYYGEDYWVKILLESLQEHRALDPDIPVVITDARYRNELTALREQGFIIIELHMPKEEVVRYLQEQGVAPETITEALRHPSETEWRTVPADFTFPSHMGNLPILLANVLDALGIKRYDEKMEDFQQFFHTLYPDRYPAPDKERISDA